MKAQNALLIESPYRFIYLGDLMKGEFDEEGGIEKPIHQDLVSIEKLGSYNTPKTISN